MTNLSWVANLHWMATCWYPKGGCLLEVQLLSVTKATQKVLTAIEITSRLQE